MSNWEQNLKQNLNERLEINKEFFTLIKKKNFRYNLFLQFTSIFIDSQFFRFALMYNFRLYKFLQDSFSLKKFEIKFVIVDVSSLELFR